MSKRHKDFGAVATTADYEPLSFTLDGEEYWCKPAINGAVLLRFVREADSDSGGQSAGALLGLFEKVLLPEDNEKFAKVIDDPEKIIDINILGEIAAWVVEQYTQRPTKARSGSSRGRTTRGSGSTDSASAVA
jgi:hypothetical protein